MGMKPTELKKFLKESLVKIPHRSIFVYGPVGVGKSSIIKELGKEMGWEVKDVRLSLLEPTDLRGLPAIDKEKKETIWTRPTFLPAEDYQGNMILFLDEMNTSNKSMQNAALQLVLDRTIGEYKLPDKVRVVCAGNRLEDGAFVTKISGPLTNRFINTTFEISFEEWKTWAYNHGIHPMVIGFLNWRKGDLLYNYNEKVDTTSFASPRSWEYVSEIMSLDLDNGVVHEAIKSCVGEAAGIEFYGFLKIHKDLPNPEDILLKGKNDVPKESNVMYALISALIGLVKQHPNKVDRLIEYSLELVPEFSVVLIKDMMRDTDLYEMVVTSKNFNKWCKHNKEITLKRNN